MATESLINPFSGYGSIVSGERFVGRLAEIEIVKQRVLGNEFSNLSITGLPRIGKSSLLYHCLVERTEELAAKKTIVIYYQMGSTRSSLSFYRKLVSKTDQFFQEHFPQDKEYEKFVVSLTSKIQDADIDDITELVEAFFKRIRHLGYKLIYILDEFDKSQSIFEFEDFQFLREISHDPHDKICLITCSRKTLDELEIRGDHGDLSLFAKIFKQYSVNLFDEDSIEAYWNRVDKLWKVDDNHKIIVHYLVGNHPWLMDVVNDCFFLMKDSNLPWEKKVAEVKLQLIQGLDHMIATIEKEHLLDAAIQLVMGPMFDVTEEQKEKLLKYGFLRLVSTEEKNKIFNGLNFGPSENGYSYVCFSDYCSWDFYRRYYTNIPIITIWSETENLLRYIVKEYLSIKHTSNWEIEMRQLIEEDDIKKWENDIKILKKNMQKMIDIFPQMQTQHLVDFTLTSQIFDIFIKKDWNWFGGIFKEYPKQEWFEKFDFLTKLRNPIAHNNPGDLKVEIETARVYCAEIKNAINKWQKNIKI